MENMCRKDGNVWRVLKDKGVHSRVDEADSLKSDLIIRLNNWHHESMESNDSLPRITLRSRIPVDLVDPSGDSDRHEITFVLGKQAYYKSGLLDERTPPKPRTFG